MAVTRRKRAYHHGDLRRALVAAAWQLVGENGLLGLTLREVARKVGVTHAAPYHHFPTRDALLDALAEEGFAELDLHMVQAVAAQGLPDARLMAVGRAYIDFARAHPERLQVMFRRRTEPQAPAAAPLEGCAELASTKVFGHLLSAVQSCQAHALAPPGDPHELALVAWSLVHGFSKLWTEGPLENMARYGTQFEALRDALLRDLCEAWTARAMAQRTQSRRMRYMCCRAVASTATKGHPHAHQLVVDGFCDACRLCM